MVVAGLEPATNPAAPQRTSLTACACCYRCDVSFLVHPHYRLLAPLLLPGFAGLEDVLPLPVVGRSSS